MHHATEIDDVGKNEMNSSPADIIQQ